MYELRRYWLAIAASVAVAFAVATPPFQAPDEVGHYWRAYTLARGEVLPSIINGKPTGLVPRGVRDIVVHLWVPTAGHPELKIGTSRLRAAAGVSLQRSELVPVTFPAQYTPVPYTATVIACWVGNQLNLRPLLTFYLGRVLNAGALLLLIVASVRRPGASSDAVAAVALLPMTLFLAGSYSPDAITIGTACYVTSLVLAPEDSRPYWYRLVFSALGLALCKPVYFLVPLMAFATTRLPWRKNTYRYAALIVAILAGVGMSAATARRNYFPMRTGVVTNPSLQFAYVQMHPVRFVSLALRDYVQHASQYEDQFVGHLGWLDIQLPQPLVTLTFFLLIAVGVSSPANITMSARINGAIIIAASCLLISLSQYLAWASVGGNAIEGMQGRYFLPLAPLSLKIIGLPRTLVPGKWPAMLFVISALLLDVIGLTLVVRRYY